MKTNRKTKITKEMTMEFVELYKNGSTLRNIADVKRISPNTVKKYLLLNNIKINTLNIINKLYSNDDLLIGLYVGVWCGDGTQYKDRGRNTIKICCNSKDSEMISFYQSLLLILFNKKSKVTYEDRNRALIRFYSRFIFDFVLEYVEYKKNKTHSVLLKQPIENYSKEFINGFFLGLMLSDGHLNKKFSFNVTSPGLADNMISILIKWGYNPRRYIHKRKKYNWKDLIMITLIKKESKNVLILLDEFLQKAGSKFNFIELKGYRESGPDRI